MRQSTRRNQYYSTDGSRQALLTKVLQKFLYLIAKVEATLSISSAFISGQLDAYNYPKPVQQLHLSH